MWVTTQNEDQEDGGTLDLSESVPRVNFLRSMCGTVHVQRGCSNWPQVQAVLVG